VTDVIYMTPLDPNEGVIYMEPLAALTGTIYMYPKSTLTTGQQGDEPTSIEWTLKGAGPFYKGYVETDWNMTPGDWAASSVWPPLKYSGWKYAKFVAYPGSYDAYWKNSLGVNVYTFQYKSSVAAGNLGDVISLGTTGLLQVGYYDATPASCSGNMGYKFYLGK